ncbi:FAD-dependent oxidoreductase [uncultured Roseobacter sp.]|uniref:NAD(P)/FAD-dependent oxidoreductase n=1 Tax=uncultured Roseobacter sp. TaxID=114847 RepID=UPI002617181B|nr:FAD-dependent oxidoreductase [uncultured Roseobacter sp.]
MKVIVVGAGIIGALTALRLAQAGAEVTVIEAGHPPSAASGASFGWINASFHANRDHFNLRLAGMEAHRRLSSELASEAVQWPGCLWWEEEGAAFDAQRRSLVALGYKVREIDRATFSELEPAVVAPDRALHFMDEGVVDLGQLALRALQAGADLGMRLITGVRVTGFDVRAGVLRGVRLAGGVLGADRCVVAAGVATQGLLERVGVALPMLHRPGLILRSEPLPTLLRHVLVSPGQELRQLPQGELLAPTMASHQGDTTDSVPETPDRLADQAMARVSTLLNCPLRWEMVTLAARPVPQDGLPVMGACGPEGLYVSTMHSGATLAPLAAELVAAEVLEQDLTNTQSALVAPYRPQRFTG